MLKVRMTRTASGKTAVQVVERSHQQTHILHHMGSAETAEEIFLLKKQAYEYIIKAMNTHPLFPQELGVGPESQEQEFERLIGRLSFTNTIHAFAYEFLSFFYEYNGFGGLRSRLLRDLVIMRIIEPCSKLHAIELLQKYFGISYGKTTVYEGLRIIRLLQNEAEQIAITYAKRNLKFNFSLVFYDVTTLYFESFTQDTDTEDAKGIRKNGFSKDNKSNQPQIVIGLIVTKEGFPVSYEIFSGNTFEGDTFIPMISRFKDTYEIKNLTVVADAAMISLDNVEKLVEKKLSYIVGARVANLTRNQIKQISTELRQTDGTSTRIETERGLLVCDFSKRRYQKDKREMEKQITKAERLLEKKEGIKRTKFIKNKNKKKAEQILNTILIEKTKLLLGIKGYYTNLTDEADKTIIDQYHNLWHVEKSFRIAKSDLQARPIFHRKRESIETHILIVFISLCVAKSIELKTEYSIKKVKEMIWNILDIEGVDTVTNKIFIKRMNVSENPMVELIKKLKCG